MVKLYGKPLRVNKAAQERNTQEVGANLFIGGLDPDVDEKVSMGRGASESGELLLGVALGSCSWELPLRVALGEGVALGRDWEKVSAFGCAAC